MGLRRQTAHDRGKCSAAQAPPPLAPDGGVEDALTRWELPWPPPDWLLTIIGQFEATFVKEVVVCSMTNFPQFANKPESARCWPFADRNLFLIAAKPQRSCNSSLAHELAHGVMVYEHGHSILRESTSRPEIRDTCQLVSVMTADWFAHMEEDSWERVPWDADGHMTFARGALKRLDEIPLLPDHVEARSAVYGVLYDDLKARGPVELVPEYSACKSAYMRTLKRRSRATHERSLTMLRILRRHRNIVDGPEYKRLCARLLELWDLKLGSDYVLLTCEELWGSGVPAGFRGEERLAGG